MIPAIVISACSVNSPRKGDSGPPRGSINVSSVPDAVPKYEAKSKYGNPESYVVSGNRYRVLKNNVGYVEVGIASWYGEKFHGRRTSNGETYDMYAMTAAHKSLPLPSYVEVINRKNGRKIIVRVNDRGPFHKNRIIDLSYTAAAKLDIIKAGTGLVEIRAIHPRTNETSGKNVSKNVISVKTPVYSSSVSGSAEGFYIQVGSFSNPVNAGKLRARLEGLANGIVHIRETELNDMTMYRVRIGPIDNIDVADKIVASLGEYGITEHHVVLD